jgi:hypothetical protein
LIEDGDRIQSPVSWAQYIELVSIYWAQLNRFHPETETEASPRNAVLNKGRAMDNVTNVDSYINIPSSQTYRSYRLGRLLSSAVKSSSSEPFYKIYRLFVLYAEIHQNTTLENRYNSCSNKRICEGVFL